MLNSTQPFGKEKIKWWSDFDTQNDIPKGAYKERGQELTKL